MNTSKPTDYPVTSHTVTLSAIVAKGYSFSIPIYQRLYVWGNDQIKALLEDLYKAYTEKKKDYYLGGVIVIPKQDNEFDLVDGQQRFTTLWLIGTVLKGQLWDEFNFCNDGEEKRSRLRFATRDAVSNYFNNFGSDTSTDEELIPITKAIKVIERLLRDKDFEGLDKAGFSEFIYKHVRLMTTQMPKETDENKLFEVSNNRGMQLEHHQILKARLLKHINDPLQRGKLALLWDACSHMNSYIEKNIKDITGLQWKELTGTGGEGEKEVGLPKEILKVVNAANEMPPMTLSKILGAATISKGSGGEDDKKIEYDSGKVRSIISFPMLLIHTLRVYSFRFKDMLGSRGGSAAVDEKKLLAAFTDYFEKGLDTMNDKERENKVTQFIQLLWDVRVKFDKHIIKWVEKERNVEIHAVKKLYLNKDTLVRKEVEGSDGFALLQSMLYHSQQIITHYWLTPLLNKLLDCEDNKELYAYLRRLDDCMFCSGQSNELRVRSWDIMTKGMSGITADVKHFSFNEHLGTGYGSYVFYKVDFILWYMRDRVYADNTIKETKKQDWDNYRMTAKNSVEHVSPQHAQDFDSNILWEDTDSTEVRKVKTDDFGNLVLITSSMNSEYSNKVFKVKREEFLEKANNRRLDSLKSALIYENKNWNPELCKAHKKQVEGYCKEYFKEDYGKYTF